MPTDDKITIQKAKEILGDKAIGLTDKQIAIILRSLYALCEKVVQSPT